MSQEATSGNHENELAEITEYLGRIGLAPKDLTEQRILDIGAGEALIAPTAKQLGLDITYLDNDYDSRRRHHRLHEEPGVDYIQGDARDLPFESNSFDFTLSNNAVPTSLHSEQDVIRAIQEILRVTRTEFRAYPLELFIFFDRSHLLPNDEEDVQPLLPGMGTEGYDPVARSIHFLKTHFPAICVETNPASPASYPDNSYYVFRKHN